jgi:dTDP-4-dehydrorhamnose 3,5-epimerase-like enzyme
MKTHLIVEPVRCVIDPRGLLFEPIAGDIIPQQRNVHVVFTEPGCIRGNHAHRIGTETVVVTGEALVRLKEDDVVKDYFVHDGEAWRFTIPPGIPHAFKSIGTKPMLLVTFNTVPHDPAAPDTVKETLIKD